MPTTWQTHLSKYRSAHPRTSFQNCMKQASKTYRSSSATKASSSKTYRSSTSAKNPWLAHVNKYRSSHPSVSYGDALKRASATYRSAARR